MVLDRATVQMYATGSQTGNTGHTFAQRDLFADLAKRLPLENGCLAVRSGVIEGTLAGWPR